MHRKARPEGRVVHVLSVSLVSSDALLFMSAAPSLSGCWGEGVCSGRDSWDGETVVCGGSGVGGGSIDSGRDGTGVSSTASGGLGGLRGDLLPCIKL